MKPARKKSFSDERRLETVIAAGRHMLESETDQAPTLRAVIWRLMQEAMETQRSIKAPRPADAGSAMPEVYHTPAEIFATEVEMIADQITYPVDDRVLPSAAAQTRYDEVMTWYRYIRSSNPPRTRKLMLLLAAGVPPRKVSDILGLTPPAVKSRKKWSLDCIEEKIAQKLRKR